MKFSLPISIFKATRPTLRHATPARVVPEPKTFALEIKWEESVAAPIPLPVRINPFAPDSHGLVPRILRLTAPLESELEPML